MRKIVSAGAARFALLCLLGVAAGAQALVIRHDRPDERYRRAAPTLAGYCQLNAPDGAGILVRPDWILTAAHLTGDLAKAQAVNCNGEQGRVDRIVNHPGWDGKKNDIALLHLAAPMRSARPMEIWRGKTAVGQELKLVGHYQSGTGLTGSTSQAPLALREGTNRVSGVDGLWIRFVMDAPGSPNVTDLEAVSGAGDSGAPAWAEVGGKPYIVGIGSHSRDVNGNGREPDYGDEDVYSRVASYAGWIDGTVKTAATAAAAAALADTSCGPASAKMMILGTYHFSNPGLDSRNLAADDVLSARRQRELEDLANRLLRFAPTKVMVEAPYRDAGTVAAYRQYLLGTHKLSRNETEQIGFRVAKLAHLPDITPIDFEMRMSGLRPDELDDNWTPPAPAAAPAANAAPDPALAEEQRLLETLPLHLFLARRNAPAQIEADHAGYMELLQPDPTTPALYERSDRLVNWYKRNFRMFANIAHETRFPEDRVLVLVGSGHLKILGDLARQSDYFCLVPALDLLG